MCAPHSLHTPLTHTHTHTHTYTNTHALRSGSLANSTTVYLAYVPNSPYLLTTVIKAEYRDMVLQALLTALGCTEVCVCVWHGAPDAELAQRERKGIAALQRTATRRERQSERDAAREHTKHSHGL